MSRNFETFELLLFKEVGGNVVFIDFVRRFALALSSRCKQGSPKLDLEIRWKLQVSSRTSDNGVVADCEPEADATFQPMYSKVIVTPGYPPTTSNTIP